MALPVMGTNLEVQLAYGLPAFAAHFTMTPVLALTLSPSPSSNTYTLLCPLPSPQKRIKKERSRGGGKPQTGAMASAKPCEKGLYRTPLQPASSAYEACA